MFANDRSKSMHWGLTLVVCTLLCIADSVPEYIVGWSESRQATTIANESPRNLNASHSLVMPALHDRAGAGGPTKLSATQTVGFKCVHCGRDFGSLMVMDTHRRHRRSIGIACADPKSATSLSFIALADLSTGILRQHHASTLAQFPNTFAHTFVH